jgi:hemerythrin-like domain-containing protein
MDIDRDRRRVLALTGAGFAAAGALGLSACGKAGDEVAAAEDLMREHGVLRRALLVYQEAVARLRSGKPFPADALAKTARLFRSFGEDYHERRLEEVHIFPKLQKVEAPAAYAIVDVLKNQHERGRQITDYIERSTRSGSVAAERAAPLAETLLGFVRMYQWHTAMEDTVVFPAWKDTLSEHAYHEMSEQFEDIEHQSFGKDGFDDARRQMSEIERAFDLTDPTLFTAPLPPGA